jgi:hypothetical protein
VKTFITLAILSGMAALRAQPPEGFWQGYDGEWGHVSRQLIALAEATPPEKFEWRPALGVRSMSEVYMHLAPHVLADHRSRQRAHGAVDRIRPHERHRVCPTIPA